MRYSVLLKRSALHNLSEAKAEELRGRRRGGKGGWYQRGREARQKEQALRNRRTSMRLWTNFQMNGQISSGRSDHFTVAM
ncbi:hypothetical protein ACLB2K_005598 [Fragaria x ananassa]